MIYDPKQNQSIRKISVDNREQHAGSLVGTFFFLLSCILVVPAIWWIYKSNQLNRMQTEINRNASGIDVQLVQRRDTLIKLFDTAKGFMVHEKELFNRIAELRNNLDKTKETNKHLIDGQLSELFSRFNIAVENYPELKSNQLFASLMNAAEMLEHEISAAKRLYNQSVNDFNAEIVTWPTSAVAYLKRIRMVNLYEASEAQKADVSLNFTPNTAE